MQSNIRTGDSTCTLRARVIGLVARRHQWNLEQAPPPPPLVPTPQRRPALIKKHSSHLLFQGDHYSSLATRLHNYPSQLKLFCFLCVLLFYFYFTFCSIFKLNKLTENQSDLIFPIVFFSFVSILIRVGD